MKENKSLLKHLLVLFVAIIGIFILNAFLVAKTVSFAAIDTAANKNFIYLSDLDWDFAESSWKDSRALRKNQNESGGVMSLIVDKKKTYFFNGIFAHATSTVIYDIGDLGFDTFSAYLGVDSSRESAGNGVKFTIYGANDKENKASWTQLKTTDVLIGTSDAAKATVNVSGYQYLILYAHDNGSNSSDHAIYANAMLYSQGKYVPRQSTSIEWIKTVDEYDRELAKYSNQTILGKEDLKLMLLQRTLVNRVGYSMIEAYANASDENYNFLNWLFNNEKLLESYLLGGEPEGTYIKAFDVFRDLKEKYGNDLNDKEHSDLYLRMMMSISLAYSADVNFWQTTTRGTVERTPSNALDRYEVIKNLYLGNYSEVDGISTYFEKDLFEKLTIEEMRWVVNNRMSDIEIPWLNWFTQKTKAKQTKYQTGNYMDPYTYIYYSTGWNYEDPNYYLDHPLCAIDAKNKGQSGYSRTVSCDDVYGLSKWHIPMGQNSLLRLWIVWEEDGVCGSLAGTGSNIEAVYGKPSTLVSQPGHAAYFVSKRTENSDGTHQTKWDIGNAAAGWAVAYKGERMLLGWGNRSTSWVSTYNGSYLVVSQRAVDYWDQYVKAYMNVLIGDMRNTTKDKSESYLEGLKEQSYNISAWYGLIRTYLSDKTKTSNDYYQLAVRLIEDLKEFPLPMYDLLELFDDRIEEEAVAYSNLLQETLTEMASDEATKNLFQGTATKDVAKYLLGIKNLEVATFSFDGENANKLMLVNTYAENTMPFEYTLNYSYDAEHNKVSDSTIWHIVPNGQTEVDLTSQLSELNDANDIVVHIIGSSRDNIENLFFIDLTTAAPPTNLYSNDLENKIFGVSNTMEWKIKPVGDVGAKLVNDNTGWTKFSDSEPTINPKEVTTVLVRNGYASTSFPSDSVEFVFEPDDTDLSKVYIPISRLSATASSQQNNSSEAAARAIDGNKNTIWHNYWNNSDKEKWITIEVNRATEISKIEYVPRQSGTNGRFTKTKIETSLDGQKWIVIEPGVSWNNDNATKSYVFKTPTLAKYVRLTALESAGDFASAAMINLYENRVENTKSVENLTVKYISSGYIYNNAAHQPHVTVKDGKEELIKNEDYAISYQNNVNVGTAYIRITGLGIYDGVLEKKFVISKAKTPSVLPSAQMTASNKQTTLSDVSLPKGWSWKNPKTVLADGTTTEAIAVFDDKNNYESYEFSVSVIKDNGSKPVITIENDNTKFSFHINLDEPKEIDYFKELISITDEEDGKISVYDDKVNVETNWDGSWTNQGTYHITFIVTDDDGNVSQLTIILSLIDTSIEPIELKEGAFKISIDTSNLVYTGKKITPKVKIQDNDGHELVLGSDYRVEYANNINAGVATATIKGNMIYSGTIKKNFSIQQASEPEVMPLTMLTVSSDTDSLSEIILPDGWQWEDENIKLADGDNKIKILYNGDVNHKKYELEITVIKEKSLTEKPDTSTDPVVPEQPKENNDKQKTPSVENKDKNNNNSSNSNNNNNNSNTGSTSQTDKNDNKSDNKVDENTAIDNNDSNNSGDVTQDNSSSSVESNKKKDDATPIKPEENENVQEENDLNKEKEIPEDNIRHEKSSSSKVISRFEWKVSEAMRFVVIAVLIVAVSACLVLTDRGKRK